MESNEMRTVILFDFISGMMAGIEFHLGDELEPEDTFAMTIDLLIIRVTIIRTKGNQYDNL